MPDLSTISKVNREMIESACSREKASHTDCVRRQLAALQTSPGAPDVSKISNGDQQMIDSACSSDRYLNGPAAYYSCLRRQVAALQASPGAPDLSAISKVDQEMIESACGSDRYMHGPAAYYNCVGKQVGALQASPGAPDLSAVSDVDRRKIATACRTARSTHGPAAYYDCLRRQFAALSTGRPSVKVAEPTTSATNLVPQPSKAPAAFSTRKAAKARPSKTKSENFAPSRTAQSFGAKPAPTTATESATNSASKPPSTQSHIGELTGGILVLIAAGVLAGVLYKKSTKKKCVLCGKVGAATGPYCPICFDVVAEAAVRAAEEQAMAEEERRARLPRPNPIRDHDSFDPYAVLGIDRAASLEEIRAAYRREIVSCHPDKVAHLGEELQEVAKTKAQEINRAYEALAQSQ